MNIRLACLLVGVVLLLQECSSHEERPKPPKPHRPRPPQTTTECSHTTTKRPKPPGHPKPPEHPKPPSRPHPKPPSKPHPKPPSKPHPKPRADVRRHLQELKHIERQLERLIRESSP